MVLNQASSDDVPKPYGFESDPEKHRNPSCVGFTPKPAHSPAPKAAQHLPNEIDVAHLDDEPFIEQITRHRDCDQAPDRYDSVTGDFIPIKPPAPRRHQQAVNEVLRGLARQG